MTLVGLRGTVCSDLGRTNDLKTRGSLNCGWPRATGRAIYVNRPATADTYLPAMLAGTSPPQTPHLHRSYRVRFPVGELSGTQSHPERSRIIQSLTGAIECRTEGAPHKQSPSNTSKISSASPKTPAPSALRQLPASPPLDCFISARNLAG